MSRRGLAPWEEQNIARSTMAGEPSYMSTAASTDPVAPPGRSDIPLVEIPGTKVVTDPGYSPDYKRLLATDSTLLQNMAELDRFEGQIGLQRREAIRRAVVSAGLVPPGFSDSDIDPATLEAARLNQFSGAKELERGRSRGSTDLAARLAGRGILYSGGLSGGESRLQEGYERGTTQLTGTLLDAIAQYQKEAAGKQYEIAAQKARLREDAARRLAMDPRYQPRPPTYGAQTAPVISQAEIDYWNGATTVPGSTAAPPPSPWRGDGGVTSSGASGFVDPWGSDTSYAPDGTIYQKNPDGSYRATGRWK